jgi:choline dehydrogenase-like flavoprotein
LKSILSSKDPEFASLQTQKFSAIIFGTGPAGALVASKLAPTGRPILMVEAGGHNVDSAAEKYFSFREFGKAKKIPFGLSWQFGGTSNLWAGRCAPLESTDMSVRNGWPFDCSELAGHYQESAEILQLEPLKTFQKHAIPSSGNLEMDTLVQSQPSRTKKFQWNNPCFNSGDHIKALCRQHRNLIAVTDLRLLRLVQGSLLNTVGEAELGLPDGEKIFMKADNFILATGGIETPRVLMNSPTNSGHLGMESRQLGKNLVTHPKGAVATLTLRKSVRLNSPLFGDVSVGNAQARFGLGLSHREIETGDGLNHYVQFGPVFEKIGLSILETTQSVLQGTGRGSPNGFKPVKLGQTILIGLGRLWFNFLGKAGLFRSRAIKLSVRGFFDQNSSATNGVSLDRSLDFYGMPKAKINWELSDSDRKSIVDFLGKIARLISDHQIGTLDVHLKLKDENWKLNGIHSHFLGTARMGLDRKNSVTNEFGKLHDTENVFVVGSSLFPSSGYANPVMTICALSLRIGEHIANKIEMRDDEANT